MRKQQPRSPELCVFCGESTEPGSGKWVNRIPASSEGKTGWACAECMTYECDRCTRPIAMDQDVTVESRTYEELKVHEYCVFPTDTRL